MRHGENRLESPATLQGQIDVPLNAAGLAAATSGAGLADEWFDAVVADCSVHAPPPSWQRPG
jgi:broad specificity phosphatase PhoE